MERMVTDGTMKIAAAGKNRIFWNAFSWWVGTELKKIICS